MMYGHKTTSYYPANKQDQEEWELGWRSGLPILGSRPVNTMGSIPPSSSGSSTAAPPESGSDQRCYSATPPSSGTRAAARRCMAGQASATRQSAGDDPASPGDNVAPLQHHPNHRRVGVLELLIGVPARAVPVEVPLH